MRFVCQTIDGDWAEATQVKGNVQISVSDSLEHCKSTKERQATLSPANARDFAAEILRIADEIDPPKKQSTQHVKSQLEAILENNGSVKPMSIKKPIEFEARMVGKNHEAKAWGVGPDDPRLNIDGLLFMPNELPALRKAIDDYEAAVKKANTLTLGDLARGEWFRIPGDPEHMARMKGGETGSAGKLSNWYRVYWSDGNNEEFDGSMKVIRLKATFEVVE